MFLSTSTLIILASMAFALWQWLRIPRPLPAPYDVLGSLIILAATTEFWGGYLNHRHINNTALYNAFTFVEALLVLWILSGIMPKWRQAMLLSSGLIIIIYSIGYALLDQTSLMHGPILFNSIAFVILLMTLLWQLAQDSRIALYRAPAFWLCLGFLIYFAGIVPVISLHRFIYYQDWPTASKLYKIVPVLCAIRYLLAAYACRLVRERLRSDTWDPDTRP